MDAEWVRWALTALMGLIMYFGKRTLDDLKDSNTKLHDELEIVKREYLHKNDFKDFKNELKEMFQEFKQDIKASLSSK